MAQVKRKHSLLTLQTDFLKSLIDAGEEEPVWRILVLDKHAQKIITNILKVGDLRDMNVTLHLPFQSKRDKVTGVMSLYLLKPTKDVVRQLIQDFKKELYSHVRLLFLTEPSPSFLNSLADQLRTAVGAKLNRISRVMSAPCNFNVVDKNMFTGNQHSLVDFVKSVGYRPHLLFHNSVPEQTLKRFNELFGQSKFNQNCPYSNLVVILPRQLDFGSALLHSWYYGAMLHDCFGINDNQISIKIQGQSYKYNLQLQDPLWLENISTPLPQFAELVQKQLSRWKAETCSINHDSPNLQLAPQLGQRKKKIDMHTNLVSALLEQLKSRRLDFLFEIGNQIINKKSLKSSEQKDLIQFLSQRGSQEDKSRIMLLYSSTVDDLHNLEKIKACTSVTEAAATKIQYFQTLKKEKASSGMKGIIKGLAKSVGRQGKGLLRDVVGTSSKQKILQILDHVIYNNMSQLSKEFKVKQDTTKNIDQQNAITFYFIGGGCYHQHSSLKEIRTNTSFPIYYGCDRLLRGNQLI